MKTEGSAQPKPVAKKSPTLKKAESKEQKAVEKSGKELQKNKPDAENPATGLRKRENKGKGNPDDNAEKKVTASLNDVKEYSAKAGNENKKANKKVSIAFEERKNAGFLPSKELTCEEVDHNSEVPKSDPEKLEPNIPENLKDIVNKKRTTVGDDYHIKENPWKWKDWKEVACLGAMLALLLDPTQPAGFVTMTFNHGGLYFVFFYLILTLLVQLPILQLFVHIGQFHQHGVIRVFSLYGPIYRVIGICALVMYPISQSAKLESAVFNVVTGFSVRSNLTPIVSCVGSPLSCYGEYKYREFCCHSLYDRISCHDMKPKPDWCHDKRKISHGKDTAPGLHIKQLMGSLGTSEIIPPVFTAVVLVLGILGTFVPRHIFAAGVAVSGIIGLILLLVLAVMQLSIGNFGIGFRRLIKMSYVHTFLNDQTPFIVMQFMVWTTLSKYPLISIASMISPGKKLYWPVVGIHITHVLVTLIIFSGDLAMFGIFEEMGIKYKERPFLNFDMGGIGYYHGILPEFFAITGTNGWYPFSLMILFFVAVGPFCGSFFDSAANSFKRKKRRLFRHIAGSCVAAGMCFVAATVGQFHPPAVRGVHLIVTLMEGAIIFMICECTVRLYGENEHEVDLAAMYPPYNNWKDRIGPLSPFYGFTLRYTVPFALLSFVFLGINFFFKTVAKKLDNVSLALCYGCGIFVVGSFVTGLVYDLIMIKRKKLPFWRTFLPTKGHKAYHRFFPHDDVLDALVKTQESLESLSQQDSDEEVHPWDVFTCDATQSMDESVPEATQKESNHALNQSISDVNKSSPGPSKKSPSQKKSSPSKKESSVSRNEGSNVSQNPRN